MLTKKDIFDTLKSIGLKSNDSIMIHSSLKAIGEIEFGASGLINALKEYFYDGTIMMPSHTWNFMNKDLDVLDLEQENSISQNTYEYIDNLKSEITDLDKLKHIISDYKNMSQD